MEPVQVVVSLFTATIPLMVGLVGATWFLATRFAQMDARFDKIEARLDRIQTQLDRIEARLSEHESRLAVLESRS